MTNTDLTHRQPRRMSPARSIREDILIGTGEQLAVRIALLNSHGDLVAVSHRRQLANGLQAVKIRHYGRSPDVIDAHLSAAMPARHPGLRGNQRAVIAVALITGTVIAALVVAALFGPSAMAHAEAMTAPVAPALIVLAAIVALVLVLANSKRKGRRSASAHHCPGCRDL